MNSIGLYIHIPFCASKCPYCDFYSLPGGGEAMDAYLGAVVRAVETHPFGPLRADTVYFGGGTPSLLGAPRLTALLEAIARHIPPADDSEITLEANPGTVSPGALKALREGGFNRVSFGVQSLAEEELRALGRRHTAAEAESAILAAHAAGFAHISADLMLGIPRQTRQSLARSIERLCALPVDHVSAYLLKVEEGTPLAASPLLRLCPGEDDAARLYLDCVEALERAGLRQYEISSFARPGAQARHNLKYWLCAPYLGIGPAAHSYLNGSRFCFPRDLDAFTGAQEPFSLVREDGEGGGFEEYAMLRLRLREGLDLAEAAAVFGADTGAIRQRALPLEKRGLLRIEGDAVSLTPEGFLLSNAVTGALLF